MKNEQSVCPVFVLGANRSGTTWLGNLLAEHPEIVSPQHVLHWGVHENKTLACKEFAGDISDERNFAAFIELFASTDFFRLAKGNKDLFYDKRPRTFYEVFFLLMDHFAAVSNAKYWSTKLDPRLLYNPRELKLFLDMASDRYPSVFFVSIKRKFADVLASYQRMEGTRTMSPVLKTATMVLEPARHIAVNTAAARLVSADNGVALRYTDLVSDRAAAMKKVCDLLSLDYTPDMESSPFRPNSSFEDVGARRPSRGPVAWLTRYVFLHIFAACPPLARFMLRIAGRLYRRRYPFYWRILRSECAREELVEEALREKLTGLVRILEEQGGEGERVERHPG